MAPDAPAPEALDTASLKALEAELMSKDPGKVRAIAPPAKLIVVREGEHWRLDIGEGLSLMVPVDVAERMARRILDIQVNGPAGEAAEAVAKAYSSGESQSRFPDFSLEAFRTALLNYDLEAPARMLSFAPFGRYPDPEDTPELSIGKRLRGQIDGLWDSLKSFSDETGIPYRSVQDWLADKMIPGGKQLAVMAREGIDIAWVLTGRS